MFWWKLGKTVVSHLSITDKPTQLKTANILEMIAHDTYYRCWTLNSRKDLANANAKKISTWIVQLEEIDIFFYRKKPQTKLPGRCFKIFNFYLFSSFEKIKCKFL